MLKQLSISIGLLCILCSSLPVNAHHSHAMFDTAKRISISGTVVEFEYTNPHSWLKVTNNADGSLWSFETNSPSQLLRKGIKRTALPTGMKITVTAMPLKDGRNGGQIVSVKKEDGSTLAIEPEAPTAGYAP